MKDPHKLHRLHPSLVVRLEQGAHNVRNVIEVTAGWVEDQARQAATTAESRALAGLALKMRREPLYFDFNHP